MDTFQVQMEREGRQWLEYGLTVTDAFTSYRWFKNLDSKDQAASAVINIVLNAQTQLGCKVKRLYADGGTEFVNRTLKADLTARGIELHYPPARTQQLNGVAAENAVRSVKDGTRSMMIHSWAPNRFWSWASKHATFVWNRTHVSANTGKTPCEVILGKKPSAKHWGVFGCDAFFHVPKEQRGVFEPKMDRCIYLGHDPIQNCASVYVLRTKKTIQTRDVSFRPTLFTHCAALTAGEARVEELLGQATDEPAMEFDSESGAAPQGGLVQDVEAAAAEEAAAIEAGEEFVVERILAERKHRKLGLQYLVKWDNQETTWEPAAMMQEDTPQLVQQFRDANPVEAGPRRSKRKGRVVVEEAKEDTEEKPAEDSEAEEAPPHEELEEKEHDPNDEAPILAQVHIYGHECSPEPAVDWGGAWCLGVRHLLGSCSPGPADSADLSGSSREPGCLSLDDGDGEGDEGPVRIRESGPWCSERICLVESTSCLASGCSRSRTTRPVL